MAIEKFYKLRQVCEEILIGEDPVILSRKCLRGEIPGAVRVGKEWRVPESALKKILGLAN